jgi:photosystem II stability/assembly factor-like uncharacterized protein
MDSPKILLLATSYGIAICESEVAGWRVYRRDLLGSFVTCVIAQGEIIIAGTKDGIFRSSDRGESWWAVNSGLSIRHIRWLAAHPDNPQRVFAGSEPAGIFLSQDGGLSWQSIPEVAEMRDQQGWYLPYSPEAGCVRGFAFSGVNGFAAVEVGGVLVSRDYGETWALNRRSQSPEKNIHPDVHSITTHPSSAHLVAAPTGGGFFLSKDGGATWDNRSPDCYCRAVWWNPVDPDHMLLGAADWVDRNGRIAETRDGGHTWSEISHGLDLPWRNHMVERFSQVGDLLLAVLSNGELLVTCLEPLNWQRSLPEVRDVMAVAGLTLDI